MSDAGKPEGDNYLLKVDNPLVVPVGQKVRVITTANDVIHAFAGCQPLVSSKDAIPGFVRDTWFRAEKTGGLLRPVPRTVRQRTRLHAHSREGFVCNRLRCLGRPPRRKSKPPKPTTRPKSGRWTTCPSAARRSMPPTARPATKPPVKVQVPSKPSTVQPSSWMQTSPNKLQ